LEREKPKISEKEKVVPSYLQQKGKTKKRSATVNLSGRGKKKFSRGEGEARDRKGERGGVEERRLAEHREKKKKTKYLKKKRREDTNSLKVEREKRKEKKALLSSLKQEGVLEGGTNLFFIQF